MGLFSELGKAFWKKVCTMLGDQEIKDTTKPVPKQNLSPSNEMLANAQQMTELPLRAAKIQKIVENRGISCLLHFTRLENVPSIARHGLLPQGVLLSRGISFISNDKRRLDGQRGAVCVSISWPNYKMFYRYRNANPGAKWVVLSINPSVLWEYDCAFCIENAASNRVRSIPLADRKRVSAFEALFADHDFYPERLRLMIPARFPTNPQAEILVYGEIPVTAIQKVYINSRSDFQELQEIFKDAKVWVDVNSMFFQPRRDHKFWQKDSSWLDIPRVDFKKRLVR